MGSKRCTVLQHYPLAKWYDAHYSVGIEYFRYLNTINSPISEEGVVAHLEIPVFLESSSKQRRGRKHVLNIIHWIFLSGSIIKLKPFEDSD